MKGEGLTLLKDLRQTNKLLIYRKGEGGGVCGQSEGHTVRFSFYTWLLARMAERTAQHRNTLYSVLLSHVPTCMNAAGQRSGALWEGKTPWLRQMLKCVPLGPLWNPPCNFPHGRMFKEQEIKGPVESAIKSPSTAPACYFSKSCIVKPDQCMCRPRVLPPGAVPSGISEKVKASGESGRGADREYGDRGYKQATEAQRNLKGKSEVHLCLSLFKGVCIPVSLCLCVSVSTRKT